MFLIWVLLMQVMIWEERINEIEEKIVTSMWDEVYSDPIQVPVKLVTRARERNSNKHLMGWFKQLGLNQIHGGPLKESYMINAWFYLLKFPNNHFYEIGSWLAHYGGKINCFPFRILSCFLRSLVDKQISYFSFNCWV